MTSLIPILGSRTRVQLDATLSALDVTLAPEQIACLDAASAVPLGVPHAFIQDNAARLAGGSWNAWTSQPFRWCERCRMPTDAQER